MSATGCCTTLPTSSYPHVLSYLCFEEIDIFLSKKLVFRHMLPLFPSFLPTWLSQATGDREWEKAYTSCICLSSSCQEVKRRGCRGSLLLLPSHAEERRVFSPLDIHCKRKDWDDQTILIPPPDHKVGHRGPKSYSDCCTSHSQTWQSILPSQLLPTPQLSSGQELPGDRCLSATTHRGSPC